jgi:hypothetical protein
MDGSLVAVVAVFDEGISLTIGAVPVVFCGG